MGTNSDLKLKDQWVWVFGGAGYLGQAIVLHLKKAGAKILCVDLDNKAEPVSYTHLTLPTICSV